jgi:hypothetical protein
MSVTGHKTLSEVQRYTAVAERERLAEQAIAKTARGIVQPTDPAGQNSA